MHPTAFIYCSWHTITNRVDRFATPKQLIKHAVAFRERTDMAILHSNKTVSPYFSQVASDDFNNFFRDHFSILLPINRTDALALAGVFVVVNVLIQCLSPPCRHWQVRQWRGKIPFVNALMDQPCGTA
jgi:hypothetical protein